MFLIGRVLKPQGLKGEVKVEIISSFPDRFLSLKKVFWESPGPAETEIETVRVQAGFAFIKFVGVNNRNDAGKLRDKELFIPEDALHKLDENSFYLHELTGLDVVNRIGEKIGVLKSVESYPANDVFVVQRTGGTEVLIPAVKEIIDQVDIPSAKIVVNQIDGLLD